jgi:hypothetical protein
MAWQIATRDKPPLSAPPRMHHTNRMSQNSRFDPAEVRRTIADFIAIPVLIFWALFSFGPLVGLIQGGSVFRTGLNIGFLLTGLYGLLAGAFFVKWLMWSGLRNTPGPSLNRYYMAAYGGVWSIFYLIFVQMPR